MEAAQLSWRRLATLLVGEGLMESDQVEAVFAEQARSGRRFGEIAIEHGWLTEADLSAVLAQQYGFEFVDLTQDEIDREATAVMPAALARRYRALPLRIDDETVIVAIADPADMVALDDLRIGLPLNVRFVVAQAADLEREISRVYRDEIRIDEDAGDDLVERSREREEIWQAATSVPAVKLVNATLSQAIQDGASDIHFEPEEEALLVRARIDGVMRELATIPRGMQAGVTSRLKIMSALDIAERRLPQDGRMAVKVAGQPVDLRVATLPTRHGEQVVLRILQRAAVAKLDSLGLGGAAREEFLRAVRQPFGAVIVCGPTGAGKTTTLYSALTLLNDPGRVLMTIEDPIEYQIQGVGQVEVNLKAGLTFARGLRTILRSDPDVLLVGEVRDEETATIAIQAARTGHLVLTSLHTHNAAGAIGRLRDMGVDRSSLAASVNCIVAQRLVRRLCVDCREPYTADEEELALLGLAHDDEIVLQRAKGCVKCAGTGYLGRIALYEVMPIQGRLRSLIETSTENIFAAAVEAGMVTLRQNGIALCREGVSSLEEIRRVTGDRLQ